MHVVNKVAANRALTNCFFLLALIPQAAGCLFPGIHHFKYCALMNK